MRQLRRSVALLVATLALSSGGIASAERTYRVRIMSVPAGALVYVDDRESMAVGETPLDTRLSAGGHTIILELEGHEQGIESIRVRKQRRRQKFAIRLIELEQGVVEVVAEEGDEDTEGADILVEGEAMGQVPAELRLEVGAHQIEVSKDGFDPFDTWVEVVADEEVTLTVSLGGGGDDDDGDDDDDDDDGDDDDGSGGKLAASASAAVELAWRRWSYDNALSGAARPFSASLVPLLRVGGELYPLAGRRSAVRGLGLGFAAGLGLPPAAAADGGEVDTSWSELDAALRYRYADKPDFGLELVGELAYGRTAFGFAATGSLADETPEVDYRYLRVGLITGYRSGKQLLFAAFDYKLVSSAGLVAERFRSASASGLAAAGGIDYRWRPRIHFRALISYRRFAHEFTSEPGDLVEADGGLDVFYGVQLGAAYHY